MSCPICKGNAIGKVGTNQFYCWDCCVEYCYKKDKVVVYQLDDEGELMPLYDIDFAESLQSV